jgi:hypothetical protein
MKIAIMQPYFMPYLGYFQLIHSVDKFVLLDDVHFINRGWINRNRILLDKKAHLFTIPLEKASQNRLINEIEICGQKWKDKFLRTLELCYKKAPYFSQCFPTIKEVILFEQDNLSKYILNSLKAFSDFLAIETEIIPTSAIYGNQDLKGQKRLIDICAKEHALWYINPIGGTKLYQDDGFKAANISLRFLESKEIRYEQFGNDFVPNLSIIDVLMFNGRDNVKEYLGLYNLIHGAT